MSWLRRLWTLLLTPPTPLCPKCLLPLYGEMGWRPRIPERAIVEDPQSLGGYAFWACDGFPVSDAAQMQNRCCVHRLVDTSF